MKPYIHEMVRLKACDLCWGWSGCHVCGFHCQLNYLYLWQFTSVIFPSWGAILCCMKLHFKHVQKKTSFLCQHWKFEMWNNCIWDFTLLASFAGQIKIINTEYTELVLFLEGSLVSIIEIHFTHISIGVVAQTKIKCYQ